MNWKRSVAGILVTVVALGFVRAAQGRIDHMKSETASEELLYFPNEKLLNHFTAGLSSVVADLLWLRTIKYTVAEFHNPEHKFTWLEHMCNAVTGLDPNFEDTYVYGGMFMASIGSDDRAMKLLHRGVPNNPDSWKIPFEIAKIYFLNRGKEPESQEFVIHYLGMVAERSDDTQYFLDWIDKIQETHDLEGGARMIWQNMADGSDDEFLRELARSKLLLLDIGVNLNRLREAAARYRADKGRAPECPADLIDAGYVSELPDLVLHGDYYVDAAGEIQNTIEIENRTEKLITGISTHLNVYKAENGVYPESLDALGVWLGATIPPHPNAALSWDYDPKTGALR